MSVAVIIIHNNAACPPNLTATEHVTNVNTFGQLFQNVMHQFTSTTDNKSNYVSENSSQVNKQILTMNTFADIIQESQRIHFHTFSQLLRDYSHVILVDLPAHENKGYSAIALGEIKMLHMLRKIILFSCTTRQCGESKLAAVRIRAESVGRTNVVVLCQGGGNLGGLYPINDQVRKTVFSTFDGFNIIIFPQGIWVNIKSDHFKTLQNVYKRYPNVTILARDMQSLQRAKLGFPENKIILVPDMAFQLGSVARSMEPSYDIIWIKRADKESSKYGVSEIIKRNTTITVRITDWIQWLPVNADLTMMEKIKFRTWNGLLFLQRGRVVITDRLHGHILSTVLHMPHVLLDTTDNKLAVFHKTWTYGLENRTILTASSPEDAFEKACVLLERFSSFLVTL